MDVVRAAVSEILERSGRTKARLCADAGMSRTSLDAYLSGVVQPSVAQVERLAAAAGLTLRLSVVERPRPVPEKFVAVLEFGDLFPRRDKGPLVDLGPIWRAARERADVTA